MPLPKDKKPRRGRLFIKNVFKTDNIVKFAFSFAFSFALGITTTQVINNNISEPRLWYQPFEGHEVPSNVRAIEFELAQELRQERLELHEALLECRESQPQTLEGTHTLPISILYGENTAKVGEAQLNYYVDEDGELHGGIDIPILDVPQPMPSLLFDMVDAQPETVVIEVQVPSPPETVMVEITPPPAPPYNGWRGQGERGNSRRPGSAIRRESLSNDTTGTGP